MSDLFKERVRLWLLDRGLHCRPARNVPTSTAKVLYHDVCSDGRPVIFDIGANIGQTTLGFHHNFPDAIIYGFEPVPEIFQELQKSVPKTSDIRCFPLAFGSAVETREIALQSAAHDYTMNQVSSLATDATPAALRRRIQITTVDAFLSEHGIERVHILKSDTEGFEMEVFRGAARSLAEGRIRSILVETTLVTNPIHVHLNDLRAHLEPYGFRFRGVYDLVYCPDGTLFYCNALFRLQRDDAGGGA